jgi:hypothetical protein
MRIVMELGTVDNHAEKKLVPHSYRAVIGGCAFLDVETIVRYNGDPLLSVRKSPEDSQSGARIDLRDNAGELIASIDGDTIEISDASKYVLAQSVRRVAIRNRETGSTVYDFARPQVRIPERPEFTLSLLTFLPNGSPLLLHPNRIKIGSLHFQRPHFLSVVLGSQQTGTKSAVQLNLQSNSGELAVTPHINMVGRVGVVSRFREGQTDKTSSAGMSYSGASDTFITLNGPCFLIDSAIEGFHTAFDVRCSDTEAKGA